MKQFIRLLYKLTARFRKHQFGAPIGKAKIYGQKSHLAQCQRCGIIAWYSMRNKSYGKSYGCDVRLSREEREKILKEFREIQTNKMSIYTNRSRRI